MRCLVLTLPLLAHAAVAADAPDPRMPERIDMVETQIAARGITDPRLLRALRQVPRHRFVPSSAQGAAYADHPLPIGHDQTISQPYIVALMTHLADLQPGEKVLEVGTGSGYQAAVLAELGVTVYTIEIVEPLGRQAARALTAAGYEGVHTRIGDGWAGWPEAAPFDAILVTAAPERIPPALLAQLDPEGGRLVIPVGPQGGEQMLRVVTRRGEDTTTSEALPVRFVPMTGQDRTTDAD
jgi:protein-L-isoaspartate(D-aspartate) O-methyltransferase